MSLKPQDLLVCLALAVRSPDETWTYGELAGSLGLSDSEANAATRRAGEAGLMTGERGRGAKPRPVVGALLEFLRHGVRYAFYATPGRPTRGMATAHSAPPLDALIAASEEDTYVWPDARGDRRGRAVEPLYRSVPKAAAADRALYEVLALVDAVRVGRGREREMAFPELERRLMSADR